MHIHFVRRLLSRALQGFVLSVLVLTAAYVSIGHIFMANIDLYHTEIETLVSQALDIPISIHKLSGDMLSLDPMLSLEDFRLGSRVSNPAIQLAKLELVIDMLGSLLKGGLLVQEINISGLGFTVMKMGNQWVIKGIPTAGKPIDLSYLLRSLEYITALNISDFEILIEGYQTHYKLKNDPEYGFALDRDHAVSTLSLVSLLEDLQQNTMRRLVLSGQYGGTDADATSHTKFYLKLPEIDIIDALPNSMIATTKPIATKLQGEFWLISEHETINIYGKPSLRWQIAGEDVEAYWSFAAQGHVDPDLNSVFYASIPVMQARYQDHTLKIHDIGVAAEYSKQSTKIGFSVAEIKTNEIFEFYNHVNRTNELLNQGYAKTLAQWQPQGKVQDLLTILHVGTKAYDSRLTARLSDIAINSNNDLVSFTDLDGLLQLSSDSGSLHIHNESPFKLHMPDLSPIPWELDSVSAGVDFIYQDNILYAESGLIKLTQGDVQASARLQVKVPTNPLAATWGLELGILNAESLHMGPFLPNTLKPGLKSWLERAILRGRLNESGIVFHGSLAKAAHKYQKAHQLYFKIEDVVLDYEPNWPRLENTSGTLYIGNEQVASDDVTARIFDSTISTARLQIPISHDGEIDTIKVSGHIEGPFSDGLRILTETPLYTATDYMAEGWQGTGSMSSEVHLNIPMGLRAGETVESDANITLADVSITIPQYDIQAIDLTGDLRYETDTALTSPGFSGRLFERPIVGHINSKGDRKAGVIDIAINGSSDIKTLYQWSSQTLLSRVQGLVTYNSIVHIPYGLGEQEPIKVSVATNLAGVSIDLPPPLQKSSVQEIPFWYQQSFLKSKRSEQYVEIQMGQSITVNLKLIDDILAGGRLHFGTSPIEVTDFDQLQVTGELTEVNYEALQTLFYDLERQFSASLQGRLAKILGSIDVKIYALDIYGFELQNVHTDIVRHTDRWQIELMNAVLKGRVEVLDDDEAALQIHLDRLAFDINDQQSSIDPLAELVPMTAPTVDFSVKNLLLDGEHYGSWAFKFIPDNEGASLSDLTSEVRGIKIIDQAKVDWHYSNGKHTSRYEGHILVPDVAKALASWGLAPSIEGKNFDFYTELAWTGSPAMIDLGKVRGSVRLDKGKGRFVQFNSNVGPLKALGIFDFASVGRRFQLDFSDLVEKGFSFHQITGTCRFDEGIVDLIEPIVIEGTGSIFKVAGSVDLENQILDNDIIVSLPINRNLPWYAAYAAFATGPLTGAGVLIAQKIFQDQIETMSSAKYRVTGTFDKPVIDFVSLFDDSMREALTVPDAKGS